MRKIQHLKGPPKSQISHEGLKPLKSAETTQTLNSDSTPRRGEASRSGTGAGAPLAPVASWHGSAEEVLFCAVIWLGREEGGKASGRPVEEA